jgi:hypothetical protein
MKRILWLDSGDCGDYTSDLSKSDLFEGKGWLFFELPEGPLFPEGTEIAMGTIVGGTSLDLIVNKKHRYHLKSDTYLIGVDITFLDGEMEDFREYLDKEWTSDWPDE